MSDGVHRPVLAADSLCFVLAAQARKLSLSASSKWAEQALKGAVPNRCKAHDFYPCRSGSVMILFRAAAKNGCTLSVWGQKQVHTKIK